jgi:ABC-type uncharacterized transport system ATPase subunit
VPLLMSDAVKSIAFQHFRGLPDNLFDLKGKSVVVLAANGKGKSAIVDGIEFTFSGTVSRFVGSGTGGINHDEAITHAKKGGIPSVEIKLHQANGAASRQLGGELVTPENRPGVAEYFSHHPPVDSFVLRRYRILDFINDKDADRYKKFVSLLGIQFVDTAQRAFVDAESNATSDVTKKEGTLGRYLAAFNDLERGFEPKSSEEVLSYLSDVALAFELEKVDKWEELEARLGSLKAKRSTANKDRIEALTKAIAALEIPLPADCDADVALVNELRVRLNELIAGSADGPREAVLEAGLTYLNNHGSDTTCPLCEQGLHVSTADLIARLNERRNALKELKEVKNRRLAAIGRLHQFAVEVIASLRRDIVHVELFSKEEIWLLRSTLAYALRWQRLFRFRANDVQFDFPDINEVINKWTEVRSQCLARFLEELRALVPSDAVELERAIGLFEKAIAGRDTLLSAEEALSKARLVKDAAVAVNASFQSAREGAIQKIFQRIAGKVLDYYGKLHNVEATEIAECTKLELKPTSRAAAGGLKLAIQFLGLLDARDPRAYLSEGHLDSLGLCLFLATVNIFNPSGTLLVLDDVLTSIDKDHRHRVAELLMQEFAEYQVILTTHDEYWFGQLKSKARAMGAQGKWIFQRLHGWTLESGPQVDLVKDAWEAIDEQLTETSYRSLGGPFRKVIEDFLKRVAAKIEFQVKYKYDGAYTAGDFVTLGINDELMAKLKEKLPTDSTAIETSIMRVFGVDNLINDLSHDNVAELEITFSEAKDFIQGLKDLTSRCQATGLIKGRS